MDTFNEQILSIKKDTKTIFSIIAIWLLAFVISFFLIYTFILGSFTFLLVCGIIFGAFKLCSNFNIEYEYIITNGIIDIDKIINKSSRKRMLSFNLSSVIRLEKYNPNNNLGGTKPVFA